MSKAKGNKKNKRRRKDVKGNSAITSIVAIVIASLGILYLGKTIKERGDRTKRGVNVAQSGKLPNYHLEPEKYQAFLMEKIPDMISQINCHCGCNTTLNNCFQGQCPVTCGVCNGEGKIAWDVAQRGGTPEEAQALVDQKFGGMH